ncbi:hypothetical protein [Planobispora rosea]|uniref:hypothetical protein n=1 Tax=Planobispora rosea TaxID=35762 RepID=UPI00083A5D32|nr:hypothetical protein [Planobispora rosea]
MSADDILFNSIHPALKAADEWVPLTGRQKIADTIREYLAEHGHVIVPTALLVDAIAALDDLGVCELDDCDIPPCSHVLPRLRAAVPAAPGEQQ